MPATICHRLFRRTLYTAEDVDNIIVALLAGTVDKSAVEAALIRIRSYAGQQRPHNDLTVTIIEEEIRRLAASDRASDREAITRWRAFLKPTAKKLPAK